MDHRGSQGVKKKKKSTVSLTMLKPLTVWITTNCEKFLKRWKYQTILPLEKPAGQEATVRILDGTTDWFKIGKGV